MKSQSDRGFITHTAVKAGFAWHYKRYSSDPLLSQAEIDARNAKAGLWADPHAIAPWDFRHPPSGTQRLAAAAISIPIFPTDDDRGIDGLLDGNFLCCQLDVGQATVTLTGFEERAALEFALAGVPIDAIISSATLTLFFPVAPAVVNTAQVHGYAETASSRRRT